MEKRRQLEGLAIAAPEHTRASGGCAGRGEPGSWTNQTAGLGMDGLVTRDNLLQIIDFHSSNGAEPRIVTAKVASGLGFPPRVGCSRDHGPVR